MHRDDPPPAVSAIRPDAPAPLAAIVDASLRKDPQDRPADGAALFGRAARRRRDGGHDRLGVGSEATQILPRPPEAEAQRRDPPRRACRGTRDRRRRPGVCADPRRGQRHAGAAARKRRSLPSVPSTTTTAGLDDTDDNHSADHDHDADDDREDDDRAGPSTAAHDCADRPPPRRRRPQSTTTTPPPYDDRTADRPTTTDTTTAAATHHRRHDDDRLVRRGLLRRRSECACAEAPTVVGTVYVVGDE